MGEKESEVHITKPGKIRVSAKVAAKLNETADTDILNRPLDQKPYWHIERARMGQILRKVRVELVRNGKAIAAKAIEADGSLQDITFDVDIEQSSWLALRIFPSSHTNPVFVHVGKKPIRASRKSISASSRAW